MCDGKNLCPRYQTKSGSHVYTKHINAKWSTRKVSEINLTASVLTYPSSASHVCDATISRRRPASHVCDAEILLLRPLYSIALQKGKKMYETIYREVSPNISWCSESVLIKYTYVENARGETSNELRKEDSKGGDELSHLCRFSRSLIASRMVVNADDRRYDDPGASISRFRINGNVAQREKRRRGDLPFDAAYARDLHQSVKLKEKKQKISRKKKRTRGRKHVDHRVARVCDRSCRASAKQEPRSRRQMFASFSAADCPGKINHRNDSERVVSTHASF